MRYTVTLFYPRGCRLRLEGGALSPIQGRTAYQLYSQFKREMGGDWFHATVDAEGNGAGSGGGHGGGPVLLRFQRVGLTSAYAAFGRAAGAGPSARGTAGGGVRLEAAAAFLSRLDRAEDAAALDRLRGNPNLAPISPGDWRAARAAGGPSAAAFFTSDRALNDPLLHGLMDLAGAAFLDRLGLLD